MDINAINERVAEVIRGRRWIVLPDVAAAATQTVEQLHEQGADGVMVIAGVEGVGELPQADRIHYTRTSGSTIMKGIRAFIASVENPSTALLEAVDSFDPDGEAQVLDAGFNRSATIAGRAVYGARPRAWADLEDKMIVDELWDAAGVARAPSEIVEVADAPDAAGRLPSDLGTVWVADNKEGWHGGAEYARWVREPDDATPAVEWLTRHAGRVRVMPFLDGIPCSIHGFLTRNGVAVFQPVEMIILRLRDRPGFFYGSAANFWNPPTSISDEMRDACRSVGSLLAARVGYLGGFGIDGVCTSDGFRPTELNPRLSTGHGLQTRAAGLRLGSMQRLMVEGDLEIDAGDLEETVVSAVEGQRHGRALFPIPDTYTPSRTGFVFDNGVPVPVDPDEPNDGTVEIGPAAFGTIIIVSFESTRTPIGPPITQSALQLLDLACRLWDVDLPALTAPPDLCRKR